MVEVGGELIPLATALETTNRIPKDVYGYTNLINLTGGNLVGKRPSSMSYRDTDNLKPEEYFFWLFPSKQHSLWIFKELFYEV